MTNAANSAAQGAVAVRRSHAVTGTVLFSVVLIQLPAVLGGTALTALALAPFAIAISYLLVRPGKWCTNYWLPAAVLYLLLLVIAAQRGVGANALSQRGASFLSLQIGLVALLGACAFLREPRESERERYLRALCWAPATYVTVNVVLHLMGVGPLQEVYGPEVSHSSGTILQAIGIPGSRVQFPLAGGINALGPICAVALAMSLVLALRREQTKLAIAGVVVSIYAIVAIDSRGALVFSLGAVALVFAAPRARKLQIRWVVLLLPVLPVLLGGVLATFSASRSFGRDSPSYDPTTGGGRTVVWRAVAVTLATPRPENLYGYGQNGQLASGASLNYAYLFGRQDSRYLASAHNMLLQTALNIGWAGALLLLGLMSAVIARVGRRAQTDASYLALLAAILAMLSIGIVEAAGTPSNPETFVWLLLALFSAMRAGLLEDTTARPNPGSPGRWL